MKLLVCVICISASVLYAEAGVAEPDARIRPPKDCALVRCKAAVGCPKPYTPPGKCCPVCDWKKSCYYKGKFYRHGQSFKDDCNTCFCSNGNVGCTKIGCPDRSCYYKGKTYKHGAKFKDSCNTCTCTDGSVSCTEMACTDKPGKCPKPWIFQISRCPKMCSSDSDCPGVQKCCDYGCARVCRIPIKDQGGVCRRNGITYKEGERLPVDSKNPCELCTCKGGKIVCSIMLCPACVGYTPPGRCCPICGSGPLL